MSLISWWHTIYYCEETKPHYPTPGINGFTCRAYKSFTEAYETNIAEKAKANSNDHAKHNRHAVFEVCRFMPDALTKYVLNNKLRAMFWRDEIKLKTPSPQM